MTPRRLASHAFKPETLERRTMLSASVTYNSGKLEVIGTEGPDLVVVSGDGAGNLLVNGTVVGRAAGLKDVVIKTLGGDDNAFVQNLDRVQATVEMVGGRGDDDFRIENIGQGNDFKIETNEGNDFLIIDHVRAGNTIEVKTGSGDDRALLTNFTARNDVKVEMEDGNDTVIVGIVAAGNKVILDGGSGNDNLAVPRDTIAGRLEIKNFERVVPPF